MPLRARIRGAAVANGKDRIYTNSGFQILDSRYCFSYSLWLFFTVLIHLLSRSWLIFANSRKIKYTASST